MKLNTELEDIYSEMIYRLIESKKETVKVTKLHDFAIAVKTELDAISFRLEIEDMPREDDKEKLEAWDKKFIKKFVCLPYEKLQEICEKKIKGKNESEIEKKIRTMYNGFTEGKRFEKEELPEKYQKGKLDEYGFEVDEDMPEKVYLKPYQVITKMQKMSYCPYCNSRTIESRGSKAGGELDHFYAKNEKENPLLALCLYNFVPSCSVCNSAKRDIGNFQSPYDSKYDIDSVRFISFFSPGNIKNTVKVKVEISGNMYDSAKLSKMSVNDIQVPILNNFIQMKIMDEYKEGDQIRNLIGDVMDKNSDYMKSLARISNTTVEEIFCRRYGELLDDDELIRNQKGKYKRDFLYQHKIIEKKEGKYIFNEQFGGVETWK